MRTHKDLDVWKEGIELVQKVYEVARKFLKEETYSLVDQLKRSAISVPSNVAEGAARNSKKEFLQFLGIALGSVSELETQLMIAQKLGFLKDKLIFEIIDSEKFKLIGLMKHLRSS